MAEGREDQFSLGDFVVRTTSNILESIQCLLIKAGNNWTIAFDTSKSCKVNVMEKIGHWILRLDAPHRGANYEHININPSYWNIPSDPHTGLGGSMGLQAGIKFAKFVQLIQRFSRGLFVISLLIDAARILRAFYQDYQKGTYWNTVDTIASVAGGWGGGYLGAGVGAAIGTYFMPGVGTIVGGIIGAVAGSIAGSYVTPKVVRSGSDGITELVKLIELDGSPGWMKKGAVVGAGIGVVLGGPIGGGIGYGIGALWDWYNDN